MDQNPQSDTPGTPSEPVRVGVSPENDDMVFANAPNILTSIRIALVPVMVGMLFFKTYAWDVAAAIVFGIAAITDYFDGYIARTRHMVTVYGKLMDPLADKFLVSAALIMLLYLGRIHPTIVILLICREIAITGLRALASAEGLVISASGGGKWKTATQMVAIPFLMVEPGFFGIPLFEIGKWLLYISLAMSLWSARDYIVDFFKALREKRRKRKEMKKLRRKEKHVPIVE